MIEGDLIPQPEVNVPPPDNKAAKSSQFKNNLAKIQNTPLSPANIDSYATRALADLISLTDSITEEYSKEQQDPSYGKELEDRAFSYYGLEKVGQLLDYVASKELEIEKIDDLIEDAEKLNSTIVPPDGEMRTFEENDGSFRKKLVIARTKTLLFILSNDFDVKLDDPEQLSLKTGVLSGNMMRKLSYFMIDVPSLKRTILVCDEEDNVTYVFDKEVLNKHGISPDDLAKLTKPDINDLLDADPKLGRRVVYTKEFVPKMIGLMTNLDANTAKGESRALYLYPQAPEGIVSIHGLQDKLKIDDKTIGKVVEKLRESLGAVNIYRFGANLTEGFTPEQQEMIKRELENKHLLSSHPPEGVISINELSKKLGIGGKHIRRAVSELEESLGEINMFKFTTTVAIGVTPQQQDMIEQYLEKQGLLLEKAHEGVASVSGLAKRFGVSSSTIINAIERLDDRLGEIKNYRFRGKATKGYSSQQQDLIHQYLQEAGVLSNAAPEGILSTYGIAKKYGVSFKTVDKAVEKLGESLGEVRKYRFQAKTVLAYNPEQQRLIELYLRETGMLTDPPPAGFVSIKGLAGRLGLIESTINKATENLGDILGEINSYKFGGVIAKALSPIQQEMIIKELDRTNKLLEPAPEGILSINDLAKKLGVSHKAVKGVVEKMGETLGKINLYRFRNMGAQGLTPEQQEMIKKVLEEKGILDSKL